MTIFLCQIRTNIAQIYSTLSDQCCVFVLFYVLVAANNCVSNLKLNKHKLTQLKQKLHKQSLHSTQNIHINSLQKDNKPQIPNLKIILSFKLISKCKGHHTLHLTYIKNG